MAEGTRFRTIEDNFKKLESQFQIFAADSRRDREEHRKDRVEQKMQMEEMRQLNKQRFDQLSEMIKNRPPEIRNDPPTNQNTAAGSQSIDRRNPILNRPGDVAREARGSNEQIGALQGLRNRNFAADDLNFQPRGGNFKVPKIDSPSTPIRGSDLDFEPSEKSTEPQIIDDSEIGYEIVKGLEELHIQFDASKFRMPKNPSSSAIPIQLDQDITSSEESIEVIEEPSQESDKDLKDFHLQCEYSKVIHFPLEIVGVEVAYVEMKTRQCDEMLSKFGSIWEGFSVAHKVFDKMPNILNKNSSLDLIAFDPGGDKQSLELDEIECFSRQDEVGILNFDPGGGIDGLDCKIDKARIINMDVSSFQLGCSSGVGAILFGLKFIKDDKTSMPFDRGRCVGVQPSRIALILKQSLLGRDFDFKILKSENVQIEWVLSADYAELSGRVDDFLVRSLKNLYFELNQIVIADVFEEYLMATYTSTSLVFDPGGGLDVVGMRS